jgi:hypothetical protein
MAVSIAFQGDTLTPGMPMALFQTRVAFGGSYGARAQYDVARDGRFLINQTVEESITTPITLILNWKPKP